MNVPFTVRAKKVMQRANAWAHAWNHEYIGGEHILFALIDEGTGRGVRILKSLGADLCRILLAICRLAPPTREPARGEKPDKTPRANNVLERAWAECMSLGRTCVGTEDLLVGLIQDTDGLAGRILCEGEGLKIDRVRGAVRQIHAQGPDDVTGFELMNLLYTTLLKFDVTVDRLDRDVFEVAHCPGLANLDAQRDRAMSADFQPNVKVQRDRFLGLRNVIAQELRILPRSSHDLSPRNYVPTNQ